MPKVVKGTLLAVFLYAVFYLIASFNQQAVLEIPASILYLLFLYALVGCVGMVVILPLLLLKKK